MSDEVRLWRIGPDESLSEVQREPLDLEARLQNWGSSGFCVGKVGGKGERKGTRRHCSADAHTSSFPRKRESIQGTHGVCSQGLDSRPRFREDMLSRE